MKKTLLVFVVIFIWLLTMLGFVWREWLSPLQPINLLLLGSSGGNRAGRDLTDTLVLINIDPQKQKITLISIPRDIWIKSLKIKLNAAYYYGGFPLVESQIQAITGLKPNFTVLLNFQDFQEMVDLAGGVEVEIERTFDDYQYPREDEGGRPFTEGEIYEHVHFEKGRRLLTGQEALKFIRSRNSPDPQEGTDFARSLRQQKVLLAFKNKILSPEFFLKPNKIRQMIKIIQKQARTSLTSTQISQLTKLAPRLLFIRQTATYSLGNGDFLLITPPLSKYQQWVLETKSGNWQEIRKFISQILTLPLDDQTPEN